MEIITDALDFPEGPVVMPDGSVIVVEIGAGQVSRVSPDGRIDVIAKTGGGPNGAAVGPDGKLYVCNNGGFHWPEGSKLRAPHGIADDYSGGRIERIDLDSRDVEILYQTGDNGCVLRGPNDIVFDAAGGFWFTDLGKQDFAARKQDIVGIFYAKADGSHVEEVIYPVTTPNGVGLSPDGKTLYAAETMTARLNKYDVTAPGKVDMTSGLGGPGLPIYGADGMRYYDSMAVEQCGNICVATIGECGISVISPAGELVEFVETDDIFTTNIAFGGEDMMDAYITLSGTGRLAKMRWKRPGLKLQY